MFQILVDRSEYKIAFRSAVCTDDMKIQGEEGSKFLATPIIYKTVVAVLPNKVAFDTFVYTSITF